MSTQERFPTRWSVPILIMSAAFFSSTIEAQEHPKEHPSSTTKSALTPETLAKEITQFVENDAKLRGGYFLFHDEKEGMPLALTLDKVHKDKLSKVAEGTYFACSDFKSKDGKTYDLDFFLKETGSGLQVSEIMVHKEDGKARYGWLEEKGVWKRQQK